MTLSFGDPINGVKMAFFVALLATALAMGAALAHLLEFSNKIDMARDQYFIVQTVYAGWSRLGYLLAVQFLSIGAVLILARHEPYVFRITAVALLALIAAQVVFWTFTYPANVATNNWTTVPLDWEAMRRQWEYSHVFGALLQILAMASLIWAALGRHR